MILRIKPWSPKICRSKAYSWVGSDQPAGVVGFHVVNGKLNKEVLSLSLTVV